MNAHCLPCSSDGLRATKSREGILTRQLSSRCRHRAWMVKVRQWVEWHGGIVLEGDGEHPFRIGRGHRGLAGH